PVSGASGVEVAGAGPHSGVRVVQLGMIAPIEDVSRNQNFAVRQQRRGVAKGRCLKGAGIAPRLAGWIKEFRATPSNGATAGPKGSYAVAPRHQDLAVRQQGRGVVGKSYGGAHVSPRNGNRVVQLRVARRGKLDIRVVGADYSAGDQDATVLEQRRGVRIPGPSRATRGAPRTRGRVIQLRGVEQAEVIGPPRDQDLAVRKQRCRVPCMGRGKTARGAPGPGDQVIQLGSVS